MSDTWIGRMVAWTRQSLRPNRLLPRASETAAESMIDRQGSVEIRQTLAGWSLETCVKGELDRARATAIQRLGNYVNGRNRGTRRLRTAWPLVQTAESKDRWRVRIALPCPDDDFIAAAGRNGKVRLRALDPQTLAVLRVPGRPTPLAIQHAATAIRHAIGGSGWEPVGDAMLRLHALPVVLPHLGRFELALPVAERGSVD